VNIKNTLQEFVLADGSKGKMYSLPALAEQGFEKLERLPVSIRIVLESLLRNCDELKVSSTDVANLANWDAKNPGEYEIPFTVARIVLQDFTGVPLLVDLAAMRSAVAGMGKNPAMIEPLVPVDLVVDHSVQVDFAGNNRALQRNLEIEFQRNRERYEFLKWGQQAFETFSVVPPGVGIVHQVNLEYLAKGVMHKDGVWYPDTLVGTDSHTTMINGIGVVGWGVGGIEAEAGMLGQPITFLVPEVVGVYLSGELQNGVTATDLALHVTQMLRKHGVVGKFVEFFGPGASALSLPDRATIANMAPEYGATMGFFPIDQECCNYYLGTGRDAALVQNFASYFKAQGLWGMPQRGQIDYSVELELDLSSIKPAVAGPKRPQDRVELGQLKQQFAKLLAAPLSEGGYNKADSLDTSVALKLAQPAGISSQEAKAADLVEGFEASSQLKHGSVLIAAITSCTNTSNPSVMLAAGLVAKRAVELGLQVPSFVKTSLAPGSRVVTNYLQATDLQQYLDQLGFQTVGYGCTTCIGNSGPLANEIEAAIQQGDLVCASVLSGNRNFEARVHQSIKANFLMSPPLVVAFALAGRVDIDFANEPIAYGKDGAAVYLADLWPSNEQIKQLLGAALQPEVFAKLYTKPGADNPQWQAVASSEGAVFGWDVDSTYIQQPPFFDGYTGQLRDISDVSSARALGIFADSVTTDHISPAGSIKEKSPAGRYLLEHNVSRGDFNSYGSRRGNDRVMTRGTFANVRIKNLMIPGSEGGYSLYFGEQQVPACDVDFNVPAGKPCFIYDASKAYQQDGTNLIVIGGEDYGMGSSRDWAAKGTNLLGVSAVIAKSFERIHRSNLVGMGVLPLTFADKNDYAKVANLADARFSIVGLSNEVKPRQQVTLQVECADGSSFELPVIVRLDTPVEIHYYRAGGILPYVLGDLLANNA